MSTRVLHLLPVHVPDSALAGFAPHPGVVDPGIEIEVRAPAAGPEGMLDSPYDLAIAHVAVLAAGAHAEDEGFAGVISASTSDSGVEALRSRLSIPVVGAGQAAMHAARLLGRRVGVVTMWPAWHCLYAGPAAAAGAELVSVIDIGVRPDAETLLQGRE